MQNHDSLIDSVLQQLTDDFHSIVNELLSGRKAANYSKTGLRALQNGHIAPCNLYLIGLNMKITTLYVSLKAQIDRGLH